MKSNNQKPTLETLFDSKKYDLPSETFWNEFQDQVKGRALASLSRSDNSNRLKKGLLFTMPLVVVAISFFFSIKDSDLTHKRTLELPDSKTSQISSLELSILENLEQTDFDIQMSGDIELSQSDFDRSSFVEQKMVLDQEGTFEVGYLSNLEYDQNDLFVRYAF